MMFYGPWAYGFGLTRGFMFLSMGFWWIFIILAVVLVVRTLSGHSNARSVTMQPDSALEILRVRYARGEISKDEFESTKRDIAG
ncbi:MAG: SHOCT domain-containing protein [Chloroflexi bacterium]|nr:SHOCT domain-containing protein [Chloroflexota bacterium]